MQCTLSTRFGTRRLTFLVGFAVIFVLLVAGTAQAAKLAPTQQLGKYLFLDENLSDPGGQSCATCHAAKVGYTGPSDDINAGGAVYEGANPGWFGDRKPPAAAYAGDSPVLHYNGEDGVWVGGMFWDGRATGWTLGDPLAEQAKGPFLNNREQNIANPAALVQLVQNSRYAWLFEVVYGPDAFADVNRAYDNIGRAIAAYERSDEVNPFNSRYDTYLRTGHGLSPLEMQGLKLFEGKAMCSACHPSPLFTDFTYDNLGTPRNPLNPVYSWHPDGEMWVDEGLGAFLRTAGFSEDVYASEIGKVKVPTLRNVDKRLGPTKIKAYTHNGVFKSIEEVVHFYNTRDVESETWPDPEVAENVNSDELGDLGLTAREEKALVAFLKTLNDR